MATYPIKKELEVKSLKISATWKSKAGSGVKVVVGVAVGGAGVKVLVGEDVAVGGGVGVAVGGGRVLVGRGGMGVAVAVGVGGGVKVGNGVGEGVGVKVGNCLRMRGSTLSAPATSCWRSVTAAPYPVNIEIDVKFW